VVGVWWTGWNKMNCSETFVHCDFAACEYVSRSAPVQVAWREV